MNRPQMGEVRQFTHKGKKRRAAYPHDVVPPLRTDQPLPSRWGVKGEVWSLWTRVPFTTPTEGMYIGLRRLADGHVVYIGDEEGNGFLQQRTHEAWLFVISEHTNPVYVFPEDVSAPDA